MPAPQAVWAVVRVTIARHLSPAPPAPKVFRPALELAAHLDALIKFSVFVKQNSRKMMKY